MDIASKKSSNSMESKIILLRIKPEEFIEDLIEYISKKNIKGLKTESILEENKFCDNNGYYCYLNPLDKSARVTGGKCLYKEGSNIRDYIKKNKLSKDDLCKMNKDVTGIHGIQRRNICLPESKIKKDKKGDFCPNNIIRYCISYLMKYKNLYEVYTNAEKYLEKIGTSNINKEQQKLIKVSLESIQELIKEKMHSPKKQSISMSNENNKSNKKLSTSIIPKKFNSSNLRAKYATIWKNRVNTKKIGNNYRHNKLKTKYFSKWLNKVIGKQNNRNNIIRAKRERKKANNYRKRVLGKKTLKKLRGNVEKKRKSRKIKEVFNSELRTKIKKLQNDIKRYNKELELNYKQLKEEDLQFNKFINKLRTLQRKDTQLASLNSNEIKNVYDYMDIVLEIKEEIESINNYITELDIKIDIKITEIEKLEGQFRK
jgi:hypothetical protein